MKTQIYTKNTPFTKNFLLIMAFIGLHLIHLQAPVFASHGLPLPMDAMPLENKVEAQVEEILTSSHKITVTNRIANLPGFEGTWWSTAVTADLQGVEFSKSGGGSSLPANAQVAVLNVSDPATSTNRTYLIGTDGGAVLVILGDF